MSIDSDHINFLVYRYLLESGFQHSSFMFAQESGITRSSVSKTKIPPGALIAHLQRALNYVQAEVNLTDDGRPADPEDLENIEALNLLESVQPEVCDQRRQQLRARLRENGKLSAEAASSTAAEAGTSSINGSVEVESSKVTILQGHAKDVYTCAWSPMEDLLASASCDATARIWDLTGQNREPIILKHHDAFSPGAEQDVTSLNWNTAGTLLATGSYDGTARIWTRTGELKTRLTGHSSAVFSVKWNPAGTLLLTSSVDGQVIVWNATSGEMQQQYRNHTGPCVDIAWRNETEFASCSTDMTIVACRVGTNDPMIKFTEHEDEVNAIRWGGNGRYLASCSDDMTARIWSLDQDRSLNTFKHSDRIYSIAFSSEAGGLPLMLATASFDKSVKVWDVRKGTCRFTLQGHSLPVYSVAFSPDSRWLATASYDKCIFVWSTETGSVERSYHGSSGASDVSWNKSGDKVAACYSDHSLAVVPIKHLQ